MSVCLGGFRLILPARPACHREVPLDYRLVASPRATALRSIFTYLALLRPARLRWKRRHDRHRRQRRLERVRWLDWLRRRARHRRHAPAPAAHPRPAGRPVPPAAWAAAASPATGGSPGTRRHPGHRRLPRHRRDLGQRRGRRRDLPDGRLQVRAADPDRLPARRSLRQHVPLPQQLRFVLRQHDEHLLVHAQNGDRVGDRDSSTRRCASASPPSGARTPAAAGCARRCRTSSPTTWRRR